MSVAENDVFKTLVFLRTATQGGDVTSFRCLRRFTGSQLSGLGDNSQGEHFLFAIDNETLLEQGHVQIYDGVSLDLFTLKEARSRFI